MDLSINSVSVPREGSSKEKNRFRWSREVSSLRAYRKFLYLHFSFSFITHRDVLVVVNSLPGSL